MKYLLTF